MASAVCLKKNIEGKPNNAANGKNKGEKIHKKTFSFALSWDNPLVRFGEGARATDRCNSSGSETATASIGFEAPRYYTRFFGDSGNSSAAIAVYGLVHAREWERRIVKWQEKVLQECDAAMTSRDSTSDLTDRESNSNSSSGKTDSVAAAYSSDADTETQAESQDSYRPVRGREKQGASESYRHQLFNELYFLVDGGTVWTDTQHGVSNPYAPCSVQDSAAYRKTSLHNTTVTDSRKNMINGVSQADVPVDLKAFKESEVQRRSGMFCDILSSTLSVPMRDFSIESFLKDNLDSSEGSGKMTPESMDRCCAADIGGKKSSKAKAKAKAKNADLPLESLHEPLLQRLTGFLSWSRPGGAERNESENSRITGAGTGRGEEEKCASKGKFGDCGKDGDRERDRRAEEQRSKSRKIMRAISALHQQMLEHDKRVSTSKVAGDQVRLYCILCSCNVTLYCLALDDIMQ